MEQVSEQEKMLEQQFRLLIKQKEQQNKRNELTFKNISIWSDANYQPSKTIDSNKHHFSIYADKLLKHLVIEVKFDFQKISQIMAYTFQCESILYTQQNCRERWYEMHRDRQILPQIRDQEMKDKRIRSIVGMNDPFQLYNVDENLHKMEQDQKILHTLKQPKQLEQKYEGYNIFKDSIRKIDDLEKYNELQQHMKRALQKASKQVELQKPMLYTPYYDRLQQFEVLEEELTLEKMQQMMSHPIQMEVMERQLKVLDLNERNFESKIKKEVQKKVKQEKFKNEEEFQIQDNWDDYQSD